MRDLRECLYPAIEPFHRGVLPVGDGHEIYFEESGNPQGRPALVVHGGPGGGCYPAMRRFHDPDRYRIILFDQRGCGRSTPNASLEANTTWHLVADMERIRLYLGIDRWQLFGGSWGSTLSLAYAQTHPEHVTELVLRGIFTLRRSELLWFYQEGAGWVFPETFAPYRAHIPSAEQSDMIAAYYRRLTDPDASVQIAAARLWSMWEGSALSLLPDPDRIRQFGADTYARAFARIECHYFVNGGFFDVDGQILRDAHKIRHIPGVIVHGRYDMCTPVKIAFDLKQVWPDAELIVVPDGGHALTEPGIASALVRATDRFAAAG